jgi:dipeptidyl aminopeptidase/acylaminoacyl peptidase
MPFAELTIPYLRQRTYQSQLGELTLLSETPTYTSYRTSYLSDGLTIYGQLTVPKATTERPQPPDGWPAIVFVHGYIAPSVYTTLGNYTSYVDALARQGFVVFKIDLRGHDQSEGEASGAYYSSGYVIDTLNARAALQTAEFVAAQKVGLFGHSMAGNVTMRAAAAKQDIPAVVIWAGAVYTYEDMQAFGIDDNSYRPPQTNTNRQRQRELLRATHGDFDVTKEFWQQIVPVNYLDGVTTAFQFHHPVDDTVVNVEYSRNVVPVLQKAGLTADLHEYSSGGHNLTGSTFTKAMSETVRFFNEHLL